MSASSDDTSSPRSVSPYPSPQAASGRDRAVGASARGLLLVAVFLTGATALAYEVTWTRGLVRILGSTATTTAVVLAVFVGALGLGAWWGGRLADRSDRPLLLYGFLEVGAAVWAVIALELAGALQAPYVSVAAGMPEEARILLRIAVAAVVVAPGAFLLGGTLPALVRFWVGPRREAGRGTAWVYGVNTLGAVAGTLVTGFYGIEALGVRGWLGVAAAVGGGVGFLAVAVGAGWPRERLLASPPPIPGREPLPLGLGLFAAALCGAVGLGLEVCGFRILVFFVEGFTATFAAMLGVFILGLGLGSLLLGPWLTRLRRPDQALGLLLVATGAVLFLGLWVVMPGLESFVVGIRNEAYRSADVQVGLWHTALAGSAALLLAPAILLGATFPLCVRWMELAGSKPGAAVGRTYLANSLGTVVAPFVVGFGLIPLLGATEVWRFLCFTCLLAGTALTIHVNGTKTKPGAVKVAWISTAVVLLALIVLPAIPPQVDGGTRLVSISHVMHDHPDRELLEVRTDAVTTASVVGTGTGERILYTDDFAAAATGRHYRYMRMLGHLPVLLAKNPQRAMVIAFGTGTTAGAVAAHQAVQQIEVVEVSDAVYELAPWFLEANRGVLDDPRTVRIRDDGRNALLLHEPNLDVITLEPLMPYSPAGLPFYTKEFYELAWSRLRDGGVLCQWMPVHAMSAGLYAAFVRTFFEVCPGGSLWFFEQSSALIAVKGEPTDLETFEARAEAVAEDLAAAGFTTPRLVLSAYVASGRNVLGAPQPPSDFTNRTVTDLDPYPEFHPSPRAPLNTTYLKDTLEYLWSLTSPGDVPMGLQPADDDARRLRMGLANGLRARAFEAVATWSDVTARALPRGSPDRVALVRQGVEAWQAAARTYGEALTQLPGETVLTWRRARATRRAAATEIHGLLADAARLREAGPADELDDVLRAALGVAEGAASMEDGDPVASERARACWLHAAVLLQMGRCQAAQRVLAALQGELPEGTADADLVAEALAAVQGYASAGRPIRDPRLAPVASNLPPCREEGLALLRTPLSRWQEVADSTDVRAVRLAADNLLSAARRESLEVDLYRALTGEPEPKAVQGRAVLAGLLARLRTEDHSLPRVLAADDAGLRVAALEEAGRLEILGRWPLAAGKAAKDEDPTVRATFAAAASEDGDRGILYLVVDLLLDDERSVRTAAAAALAGHEPTLIQGYDPDASAERREALVEAIREGWRR